MRRTLKQLGAAIATKAARGMPNTVKGRVIYAIWKQAIKDAHRPASRSESEHVQKMDAINRADAIRFLNECAWISLEKAGWNPELLQTLVWREIEASGLRAACDIWYSLYDERKL